MLFGPERLLSDLDDLGFCVGLQPGSDGQTYAVIREFEIACGRFVGRLIDLGILGLPNYPQGVPAAIHVRSDPHLFEKSDSESGVRNIQDSALGVDWRYWSKNFNWDGEKTTRRLISQINRIFHDA